MVTGLTRGHLQALGLDISDLLASVKAGYDEEIVFQVGPHGNSAEGGGGAHGQVLKGLQP